MEVATAKKERKIEENGFLSFVFCRTIWSKNCGQPFDLALNDDNGHRSGSIIVSERLRFSRVAVRHCFLRERCASACQFRFERFTSAGLNKQPRIHRPDQLACALGTRFHVVYTDRQIFDRPQWKQRPIKINNLF